jgi:hypothetical protein
MTKRRAKSGDVTHVTGGGRWLRPAALCRALPLTGTTLDKWRSAGVVRTERTERLGIAWVSVEDVIALLTTDWRGAAAAGIFRTPAADLAAQRERARLVNEASRASATNGGQPWTIPDMLAIVEPGRPIDRVLAERLGRTVDAIITMRDQIVQGTGHIFGRAELEEALAREFGAGFARVLEGAVA